jgi:hypothetical protein
MLGSFRKKTVTHVGSAACGFYGKQDRESGAGNPATLSQPAKLIPTLSHTPPEASMRRTGKRGQEDSTESSEGTENGVE